MGGVARRDCRPIRGRWSPEILRSLQNHVLGLNISLDEATLNTPYRNTIAPDAQPVYPGNIELEEKIEKLLRWNAIAMVLRAQDKGIGVGGHIATYASCATMLEVGFNHFFQGAGPSNDRLCGRAAASAPCRSGHLRSRFFGGSAERDTVGKIIVRSLLMGAACPPIRIRAACPIFGNCQMLPWACRRRLLFTKLASPNIWRTEVSK